MPKIKAAVVQDAPVVFDPEATIEKTAELLKQAAAKGAQLAVLPEAFVSAYPVGLDFGARIGLRLPQGREDFLRYFESAIEVPGPHTHALGAGGQRGRGLHGAAGLLSATAAPCTAHP
jgi:nitrilase